jgi:type IV pilus modification protein PilV
MRTKPFMTKKQGGFTLLEPLVAIVILCFGLLGLAQFQLNMLAQTSDARARLSATTLAEELLAQVTVDPANAACYATTVADGACNFAQGLANYQEWQTRARATMGRLAGADQSRVSVLSVYDKATTRMTVTIKWGNKGSADTHSHVATTDTRTTS